MQSSVVSRVFDAMPGAFNGGADFTSAMSTPIGAIQPLPRANHLISTAIDLPVQQAQQTEQALFGVPPAIQPYQQQQQQPQVRQQLPFIQPVQMAFSFPVGDACSRIFWRRVKIGNVIVPNCVDVTISFDPSINVHSNQSAVRVYRGLLLPTLEIIDYNCNLPVDQQSIEYQQHPALLLTAHTTLSSCEARRTKKYSGKLIAQWGDEHAGRVYKSYYAWGVAVIMDNQLRNLAATVKDMTPEALLAGFRLNATPQMDIGTNRRVLEQCQWRKVIGITKTAGTYRRALLPIRDSNGEPIALSKSMRNAKDMLVVHVVDAEKKTVSKVEVRAWEESLERAAKADGVKVTRTGLGRGNGVLVKWNQTSDSSSSSSSSSAASPPAPSSTTTVSTQEVPLAADPVDSSTKKRKRRGGSSRAAAKRAMKRNSELARGVGLPPGWNRMAADLISAATDDDVDYMADGIAAGAQQGARDVLVAASASFAAPSNSTMQLDSSAVLAQLRAPVQQKKTVPAPPSMSPLKSAAYIDRPPSMPCADAYCVLVPVVIDARCRSNLVAAFKGDATPRAINFVRTQPWLYQFVEQRFSLVYAQVQLRRDEHFDAGEVGDTLWRQLKAESGNEQVVDDFRRGVQHAFEQIINVGRAPVRLLYDESATEQAPQPSAPGTEVACEELVMAPAKVGAKERTLSMPGVRTTRAFQRGEEIGTYLCDIKLGGEAQLDGEEAVYRAAGYTQSEAQDSFALSVQTRTAAGVVRDVVASARANKFVEAATLRHMNHSGRANAELQSMYDAARGGVEVRALRDIESGEWLHINYGAEYVRRMESAGIELALPAGDFKARPASPSPLDDDTRYLLCSSPPLPSIHRRVTGGVDFEEATRKQAAQEADDEETLFFNYSGLFADQPVDEYNGALFGGLDDLSSNSGMLEDDASATSSFEI